MNGHKSSLKTKMIINDDASNVTRVESIKEDEGPRDKHKTAYFGQADDEAVKEVRLKKNPTDSQIKMRDEINKFESKF